jgi:hypothetical protein
MQCKLERTDQTAEPSQTSAVQVAFNYFQEAQRNNHDAIYTAFQHFSEQLSSDWEVRPPQNCTSVTWQGP